MVALGCKYLRICHLNNCATGVATQHEVLRTKHFIGLPEMVMNYFRFVAQECREIMAQLGVRSMSELIGRVERLQSAAGQSPRQRRLDLSPLISTDGIASDVRLCIQHTTESYLMPDIEHKGIVTKIRVGEDEIVLTSADDFKLKAVTDILSMLRPDEAARAMLKGWARGEFEIHFPKRFSRFLKLLRLLPERWYFSWVWRATQGNLNKP